MISKNRIKLIRSLSRKKERLKNALFVVEGDKSIVEVLGSKYQVEELFCTDSFAENNREAVVAADNLSIVDHKEIKKASLTVNPQNAIALCRIPEEEPLPKKLSGPVLYLDDIQDPGNLGTIVRTCDWFGVTALICSPGTADIYNPKTVQAAMGSFGRVTPFYSTFEPIAETAERSQMTIYGAFMTGESIYELTLPKDLLIVIGNEGSGVSPEISKFIERKISIPSFAKSREGAESLNAAVATAIICSEYRRGYLLK